MEATRKRKPSYCVHTTEDGTECQRSVHHYPDRLCGRHYNIRHGAISRTPQRRNTHSRNDASTSDNGLLRSHKEENNGEEEKDEEEEGGAIASPSTTGAIACRGDLTTTTMTTMTMTNTATPLPSLEVNNVRQAQADQECQQQMSTTTTMTAIAMAVPTSPVPPPTVIQPPNDNLP